MQRAKKVLLVGLVVAGVVVPGGARADRAVTADPRVELGLLETTTSTDVLVRFEDHVPADVHAIPGLNVRYRFASLPALLATATPAAVRALAARDDLAYLEADKPVAFDMETATIASRAKDVTDPTFDESTPPVFTDDGTVIDGAGVGIAIVDTGLDGTHPDFQGPNKVGGNFWVTPAGMIPSTWTAAGTTANGHGTHVAGIAVGTGAASDGEFRGVAPGASVYAFSMYYATVSIGAVAFDWILQNGATQDPPIRIVSNSWHCSALSCGHPFNANQLHVQLASRLAENGFTVTWAAGNEKGDGYLPTINTEATNPTPGIIGVANYSDREIGTRAGCLSSDSAWGASADPSTWPDVAAPGSRITSTWPIAAHWGGGTSISSRNPVNGDNTYRILGGTSMATPHVAGIVALLLQANPDLTPAEIEYILKQTATPLTGTGGSGCGIDYIRADASHPWTGTNYAAGHGLVHGYDAVGLALGFGGIPAPVDVEEIPDSFLRSRPGITAEHTLYLTGEDRLAAPFPDAAVPRARVLEPNVLHSYTSDPLSDGFVAEAVKVDLYIGTDGEALASLTPPRIVAQVERIRPDGSVDAVSDHVDKFWQIFPGAPTQRDFALILPAPVTFEAGDRVRLTAGIISPPIVGVDPPPGAQGILYWEAPTTSRVTFGSVVERPLPDSREACESRQDCADVDATHMYESMTCGNVAYRLTWRGPVGSALIFSCYGDLHVCAVTATDPGREDGTCMMETANPRGGTFKGAYCTYRMPDGSRGGQGRCIGLKLIEDDD